MSPVSISVYIFFLWSLLAEVKRKLASLSPSQRMDSSESLRATAGTIPMLFPYPLPFLNVMKILW